MSIKFDHGTKKQIDFDKIKTPFAYVFGIGAMDLCKDRKYIGGNEKTFYPTDSKGLDDIISRNDELLDCIHGNISSISTVLACAESGITGAMEEERSSLSWLIVGLTELAEMVSCANSEMGCSRLEELKRNLKI